MNWKSVLNLKEEISCSHCVQNNLDPVHSFKKLEIVSSFLGGDEFVDCDILGSDSIVKVPIRDMAPGTVSYHMISRFKILNFCLDVHMSHVSVISEEFPEKTYVAKGGCGQVFKSKMGNRIVAIKEPIFANSADFSEVLHKFHEFQSEMHIMR